MSTGWVSDTKDIDLKVSSFNKLRRDDARLVGVTEILDEAETDVFVEGEAVAGGGDGPAELVVPVDGFSSPGPGVQVSVVVHRVQQQHHEQSPHPDLLLLQQSVLTDEVDIRVEFAPLGSVALHGSGVTVQVLAPEGIKFLYSDGSLGVVTAVFQPKLLSRLENGVVDVDGELVWNIEDVTQLPRVSHVHGEDVRGAGNVHMAAGVEREADAVEAVGGEVGHQSPGVRPHHTQRRVEGRHVLQHHLLRQVASQPGQRPHLLDGRGHQHVPGNRTVSDRPVGVTSYVSCVKVRQGRQGC